MTSTTEKASQTVFASIQAVAPDTDPQAVDPGEDLWYALDLDSMDQLNVMIAIGERIGVVIPEADYPKLETLNQMTDYVIRAGDKR